MRKTLPQDIPAISSYLQHLLTTTLATTKTGILPSGQTDGNDWSETSPAELTLIHRVVGPIPGCVA